MCERCAELDEKIELYRQLSTWVTDRPTREGLEQLVQKLRVDKGMLHPLLDASLHECGSDAVKQIAEANRSPRLRMYDDSDLRQKAASADDHDLRSERKRVVDDLREILHKFRKRFH
jgi:hypothetical protein